MSSPASGGQSPPVFVIARFDGMATLFTRHTRAAPGARIDGAIGSTGVEPGGVHYGITMRLRGFARTQVEDFVRDWTATYGDNIRVLASQAGEVALHGRFAVRDVKSPVVNLLVRFQQMLGPPWVSSHRGVLTLAAPSADRSLAEGTADVLRRDLAAHALTAQVEVRSLTAVESTDHHAVASLATRLAH